jgi:hypothetical protein
VGVSNTAGTLNFVINMKKVQIGLSILMIIILSWALILTIHDTSKTSSPVEEMYHRQLVVTLDSILDARFGAGCCEENIDTVNANTFRTRFGGILSPME